jgi:hypothetical protein
LRDLLDLQQRRLVAQRIALDAREAGIDHVANARHRQRRLGHVGCEHEPPAAARREHALLLGHRQAGRTAAGSRRRAHTVDATARRARSRPSSPNLALAGKEHEDVARTFAPQVFGGGDDRVLELLFVVGFVVTARERPVAKFDRIRAARHFDHRCRPRLTVDQASEVPREALGVERRRRDDHLEIGPLRSSCFR